jgi:uncharacterized protein YjbI with pentapeptide repeats
VDSSTLAIMMAMAEDKGTSAPKQGKEPRGHAHLPRVVLVVLLASLIAFAIAVFILAPRLHIPGDIDDRAVLWGIRTVAVLVAIGALGRLIRLGYDYQWTGLGDAEFRPKQEDAEFRPKKTLWDWLQLLIVPIVLSLITVAFTWQQNARQQEAEVRRAEVDRQIEEHRADDAALQAYLDQMNNLLLEHKLRSSENDWDEVRTLARARTLTVLSRLDPSRKMQVMQFLTEARLVNGRDHVISLKGADLRDAPLRSTDLTYADLTEADLRGANLREANLADAILDDADLRGANLKGALLTRAELLSADLRKANLEHTHLVDAWLSNADLRGARNTTEKQLLQADALDEATMPNGKKYEDWIFDVKENPSRGPIG